MSDSQPERVLVEVTPDRAAELLLRAHPSRQLNRKLVQVHVVDMRAGTWVPGDHQITVDKDGRLVAGQHQLVGVMEAGLTVPMYFAEVIELPREDQA